MHVVLVDKPNPLNLPPGKFLAEDVNAGEMLSRGWCTVVGCLNPFNRELIGDISRTHVLWPSENITIKFLHPDTDYNGKKILFVRPGGFGDLLFLTPTFAEIKRRWPESQIYVSCFARYQEALHHNPDVAGFIPYPTLLENWRDFDAHVWCENLIEENEEARSVHAVELAAQRAGISLDGGPAFAQGSGAVRPAERRRMRYFVTEEERARADEEFPRTDKHRIGLQMSSGQPRAYPHMQAVSKTLWKAGNEVFLFGRPKELKTNEPPGVVNLMLRSEPDGRIGKTFRESCAILATCDVMVVPDSALCHVAGALDVPTVALYGPFPWHLRTAHAKGTFALQGRCPVSPCFHHVRPGKGVFPSFGPCATSGTCEALESIEPERVVRAVEKMLEASKAKAWPEKRDLAIRQLESAI